MTSLIPAPKFAAELGMKPQNLYDARSRGVDLPKGIKIGSRLYFDRRDIDAWIDEKRTKAS